MANCINVPGTKSNNCILRLEIKANELQSRVRASFSAPPWLYIPASLALIKKAGYRAWFEKNSPTDTDSRNDALPNQTPDPAF